MSSEKIKPVLNGTAETMLQCFYARAMHSKNPKNKFHDAKAEELVERLDYDFSNAKKDNAMSGGIVARSVVFDELVSDFISKNPDCTVVNIACGLDTRVYRMDNGRLTWYNLDLPETIEVRDSVYQESGIWFPGRSSARGELPSRQCRSSCRSFPIKGRKDCKTLRTPIRSGGS